jgi:hypothetical protein
MLIPMQTGLRESLDGYVLEDLTHTLDDAEQYRMYITQLEGMYTHFLRRQLLWFEGRFPIDNRDPLRFACGGVFELFMQQSQPVLPDVFNDVPLIFSTLNSFVTQWITGEVYERKRRTR